MNYDQDGLSLTEQFEGCRLEAYQDQVGVWTIGYGHTKGVHAGMTCTLEEAQQFLCDDVAEAVAAVNHLVTIQLSQGEFDALVDFTFNLGIGNFASSTLLKKLNAGDIEGAADEFLKWDVAGGQHVAGLLKRRQAERALFFLNANLTGGPQA
jgi:lysozyme